MSIEAVVKGRQVNEKIERRQQKDESFISSGYLIAKESFCTLIEPGNERSIDGS
jgi:hypothetical protein